MIFCSIQKLVTKRVTHTSEKYLGVAKTLTYIENALVIFQVRCHKSAIFKISHYHQEADLHDMEEDFHEALQHFDFLVLYFLHVCCCFKTFGAAKFHI